MTIKSCFLTVIKYSIESIMFARSSKVTKSSRKESGTNKKQIETKTKLERTSEAPYADKSWKKKRSYQCWRQGRGVNCSGQGIDILVFFRASISIQNFFRNFRESYSKWKFNESEHIRKNLTKNYSIALKM